jgi:hypothetical protein
MSAVASAVRKALARFGAVKIMTMAELIVLLHCSVRTAHRRLKSWSAMNSYNCNGRFYTVPQVVQFDADGLWRCRGAFFSRHGSLTETVVALVGVSSAGLTAAELGAKLGVNAHSFLSRFAAHPLLARERIGGRHVYFSSAPGVRQKQVGARRQAAGTLRTALPSDAAAVLIFAEMIRHPGMDPEGISHRLATQGTQVDAARILRLLEHHGLQKKRPAASPSCLP